MQKNWKRILFNITLDLVLAGIALCVFALFHHVLPREQESVGIVIARPTATATENAVKAETEETKNSVPAPTDRARPAETAKPEPTESTRKTIDARPESEKKNYNGSGRGRARTRQSTGTNEKGGSALSGVSGDIETATDSVPMSEKFADKYTDTVTETANSYTSPNVSVTVTQETTSDGRCTYYLADIYLKDITSLRAALANDTYGSGYRAEITDMAVLNNALLAVNGDYYGNTTEGVVIRNGVIYRANDTDCDVCVIYYDGTMRVIPGSDFSVEDAIEDGAWQAWTFGPALLDSDGNAIERFDSTRRLVSANPRTAIGYYETGHYCLVVVDGRGESEGMTMQELSQLFASLGCTAAYNLDGGNSSVMVWNGMVVNEPSGGGRASSDAILITEVTK